MAGAVPSPPVEASPLGQGFPVPLDSIHFQIIQGGLVADVEQVVQPATASHAEQAELFRVE
jgi:hypothetical protein